MTHLNDIVKKMTDRVQTRCAERLELAAQNAKNVCKPYVDIKEYGISNIMKKRRGL